MITPERLEELKRLARAATPGPWKASQWHEIASVRAQYLRIAVDHREDCGDSLPDANYIAAASPDTVLALIEEIERLRFVEFQLGLAQEALKEIAKQKTTEEIEADGDERECDADVDGAYDAIIGIARGALVKGSENEGGMG